MKKVIEGTKVKILIGENKGKTGIVTISDNPHSEYPFSVWIDDCQWGYQDKEVEEVKKIYKIKVTGSGTPEQIIERLKELVSSLESAEIDNDFEGQYEDSILYTEISETDEFDEE